MAMALLLSELQIYLRNRGWKEKMNILYFINYTRTIVVYLMIRQLGIKNIIRKDMKKYYWFISNDVDHDYKFIVILNILLLRNMCFRNVVYYRLSKKSQKYIFRILFKTKKDLEIYGDIDEGIAIYHGHGTIIDAVRIGKNFSVYQGVTIGKNVKPGDITSKPIIGDNVAIYANAVIAGEVKIGNNVSIGAGTVVMKDIPNNSLVYGNPCIIKTKSLKNV